MSLRRLYYNIPPRWRYLARKLYYLPVDTLETITGKRNNMVPKKGDTFIGSGDFVKQGEHQCDLLRKYTCIDPGCRVLDIGCGIGRTAVPLTAFLNSQGSYEGFDVVKKGIDWCNKHISGKFKNFHFTYVPLNNDLYNTHAEKADTFRFPYKESEFDVAFLFSVFTHMQTHEIGNYLNEIQRTLKPGGMCLATFFIYSDEQEEQIANQA